MTLNDPLANVFSVIMNGETRGKNEVQVRPVSKVIKTVLDIMQKEGYIGKYEEVEDNKGNSMIITLSGAINKCGAIKPRFAVGKDDHVKFEERYLPARNVGIIIVSTSQGIMTNIEAKKKSIGGKLLGYCY